MRYDKGYNAVTFLIDYGEMGFGQISNFIYKVLERIELSSDEAGEITYRYYVEDKSWQSIQWVKIILNEQASYRTINEPWKIKNLGDDYRINFLIIFREETLKDIVELQNFYLLKKYFKSASIWGVFYGSSNFYFKTSQYLSGVYDFYPEFYDYLYYHDATLKRMQREGIAVSGKIMPLQVINSDTLDILFRKTAEVLGEDILKKIIAGEEISRISWRFRKVLGGTAKLLSVGRKMLAKVSDAELYRLFSETSVLALVYLAYFLSNSGKNDWEVGELRKCLIQFEEYAHACRQLSENIVFHSTTGEGCLSLRIYSHIDEYIKDKYYIKNAEEGCYFEIEIADYAADNRNGNIAENFKLKIKDSTMVKIFEDSVPSDFFGKIVNGERENNEKWKEYYSDSRNIGKHFGLRIFEKIVYQKNGIFIAESHSCHKRQQGEYFSSGKKQEKMQYCMPGTRFSIIFPVGTVRKLLIEQEASFNAQKEFSKSVNKLDEYATFDCGNVFYAKEYTKQSVKEAHIQEIADIIKYYCESSEGDILYFSAENMRKYSGEILAKAAVLALYHANIKKHIVFYRCSKILMEEFKIAMETLFMGTGIEDMFSGIVQQIVLYSDSLEEIVFIPRDCKLSHQLNKYLGIMKAAPGGDLNWIPFEIFKRKTRNTENKSLFEMYTEKVLAEDIQSDNLGCRINHTHMRLGSTIHIDEFYEAEIIFGTRFFTSRFAYLIVRDIKKEIEHAEKITLYGYATYSENLLIEVMKLLREIKPELDVDFAILEREAEHRGLFYTDRIRYNRLFASETEKKHYFRDRKVVVILPINSTSKTRRRMIALFAEQNEMPNKKAWVIKNFALILVGSKEKNNYWNLETKSRRIIGNVKPYPQYYVKTEVDYNEALDCKLCFPENPVAEMPLIEVNASSTIPNQLFGLWSRGIAVDKDAIYQKIQKEESMLKSLKDCLIYGHICRKESHFLYYFQTEYLFATEKEKIKENLKRWAEQYLNEEELEYNLIVTPLHFSNAGFVELVDDVVFHGTCMILRVDFDKEYRSNMYAKYSNIRSFVDGLRNSEKKCILKIHYVDDNIISGKTFYRAKSLVESVLDIYRMKDKNIEIHVFDKVFTLLDRNSTASRIQYIRCWNSQEQKEENLESDFYSYLTLSISSLRNYGNSCIGCNLEKEAKLLYQTSSTKEIADYWSDRTKKYALHALPGQTSSKVGNKLYYKREEDKERAYRRMVCSHIARKILEEQGYINGEKETVFGILQLLNSDYINREENQFEYFLSYLKVLSRPFLSFQKSIKEAIFDILLVIIDALIKKQTLMKTVDEVKKQKPYLSQEKLKSEWQIVNDQIIYLPTRSDEDKLILLLIVMRQLTELKSNYIMRPDAMKRIYDYAYELSVMQDERYQKEFQKRYVLMIKKLIGISTDTSKSLWLDRMIRKEMVLSGVPGKFQQWIILENTRIFREGMERLNDVYRNDKELIKNLDQYYQILFLGNEYRVLLKRMKEFKENKLMLSTPEEIESFLRKNLQNNMICTEKTIVSLKKTETNFDMKKIFDYVFKKIEGETGSADWTHQINILKNDLRRHMNVHQDKDFYALMAAYGMAEAERNIFTEKGVEVIADCLGIYQICEQIAHDMPDNTDEKIVSKIHKMAVLMQNVLHAYKLQVIMEKSYGSDWWKEHILERFNRELVEKNFPGETNLYLKLRCKKDYMLLADSTAGNTMDSTVDETVTEYLEGFKENKEAVKKGYMINRAEGNFIWKLGNMTYHDIFFYAEFDQERERLNLYNDLRNMMMFYNLFQTKVFNTKESSVLHELMVARSELEVYNRDKAHSHTKNDVIQAQYKQALTFGGKELDRNLEVYRSGVLTLLADLNVSELYRNSLKSQFYIQKIEYDYRVLWGDLDSVVRPGMNYYVTHGVASDLIKIELIDKVLLDTDEHIRDDDRVLCGSDSKRQFFLLLLSIALNAAGKERGKVKEGKIDVYLSKTADGNLRIMNEAQSENLDVERINREIRIEPEREERGISFWAMSRYIKRMLCRILEQKIEDLNTEAKRKEISEELIKEYSEIFKNVLSEKFELKAQLIKLQEKNYFSIEIPVFWEKYQKELNVGKGL